MDQANSIATPIFDSINPSGCFNARLRKLHRLLNSVYMAHLKPFGIRGSMLSILFIIGKKPGVNQKSVAEWLVLDPSTMSRDLKKLETRGFVRREAGEDLRNSVLTLTKEGQQFLEEVSPVWQNIHQKVNTILGSHHGKQIDVLIKAVASNLEELKP